MTTFAQKIRDAKGGSSGTGDGEDWYPPNGAYEVEVVGGFARTANSGSDYAKLFLRITEGDLAGREFGHFMSLNEGKPAEISLSSLSTYGVDFTQDFETIEALDAAIKKLGGVGASVTTKVNGQYLNVSVGSARALEAQTRIPVPAAAPANAILGDEADDDLPF